MQYTCLSEKIKFCEIMCVMKNWCSFTIYSVVIIYFLFSVPLKGHLLVFPQVIPTRDYQAPTLETIKWTATCLFW